jgi:hypothetical protein
MPLSRSIADSFEKTGAFSNAGVVIRIRQNVENPAFYPG